MDIEYLVFAALMAFLIAGCIANIGRSARLERAMKDQLKRSSETIHAPLD